MITSKIKFSLAFRVLLVATFIIIPLNHTALAAEQNILIVLDGSGSMLEAFGGTTRIEAAKSAVNDLLSSLDKTIKVGFRPYAHIKRTDKTLACKETELLQNFTTNYSSVMSKVNATMAVGSYTPTAYALTQSEKDFNSSNTNTLVLLTDGKETCGGDPEASAKALKDAGINVKTYVIGLDVDSATRGELSSIAKAGGGSYFDANNSTTLADSLKMINEDAFPVDKTNTDSIDQGTRVRGGNGFESAVPITIGKYQLDHHLRTDEYDYFKFAVEKGKEYRVSIQNQAQRIYFDTKDGVFKETVMSLDTKIYSSIYIHATDRQRYNRILAEAQWEKNSAVISRKNYEKSNEPQDFKIGVQFDTNWTIKKDLEDQSFVYLLVGNHITEQHKDTIFEITDIIPEDGTVDPSAVEQDSSTGTGLGTNDDSTIGGQDAVNNDESTATEETKNNILLIVLIVVGVLVLAGIIVVIVLLARRSKARVEVPASTPGQFNTPPPPEVPNDNPVPPPPSREF